ncbi:aminoacyl-tRNA hydrolase [Campylobacter sp. MIT 99-7217]|uniref:aminoacyl-tRNA hydrolase n=1 Tax=Campylobacter sp. MIT 99-7217 TaxID=535091 RepID=UPI001156E25B|nr:aminoacyl-tRNA hydrolase [Campylobacter sp. MIT 99-7217]TQR30638.1 aminoacyl-tRNA hydrolase [Campylobacter sp. MIT 99-7217]
MILVVGLGNLGETYDKTRHNAGFMLLDLFLEKLKKENLSQTPISNAKFKGELVKCGELLLLKPHTFMNASGLSVKAVKDFYKCERMVVLHDDIDLKLGALKFKKGGSSGGHNGLKSIDTLCGNDYERVRIGVGKDQNVIDFVLGKFTKAELEILNPVLAHATNALSALMQSDITQVASKFSLKA